MLGLAVDDAAESSAPEDKFDLDEVKGNVVATTKVTIGPFQTEVVKGNTKVTGHKKRVHVIVEALDKTRKF